MQFDVGKKILLIYIYAISSIVKKGCRSVGVMLASEASLLGGSAY